MLSNCEAGGLLRVPWTARRLNQSVLKEISPEYTLEGLMLKLKLRFFGYLMWRASSLEKTLMLGKTDGTRGRGWQKMRQLDSFTNSMHTNLSKLQEIVKDREAWHPAVCGGHKESVVSGCTTTTLSNIAGQRGLGRKPEIGLWDLEAQGKPGALC